MKQGGNYRRRLRRKHWLLRRARRNFHNPRQKSYRKRIEPVVWGSVNRFNRRSIATRPDKAYDITLPARLDFDNNYEETVSHLQFVRDASKGRYVIGKLRFDGLEYISPAAALVLASEVDRWNQRVRGRLKADVDSWQPDIKRLLCEMGYFELLHLVKPPQPPSSNSITFLKFLRGESVGDPGKLAQALRKDIEQIVGVGIRKGPLFVALSEAITNVSQHAYPPMLAVSKKQWWLSASFNRKGRMLTVMFYDQGIGIPRSLPTSSIFEGFREFFGFWSDAQKIEAAMEYGRSSTERRERGKGLTNLREFAKAHNDGKLSIYSQRGMCRVKHELDGKWVTERREHETPLAGTLIEWSVNL